jgi:hypothetical protein
MASLAWLLDGVWIWLVFLTVGFWFAPTWEARAGGGLALAALIGMPLVTALLVTPLFLYTAAALGFLAGLCLRIVAIGRTSP